MEPLQSDIHILTLGQMSRGQDWRLQLAHDLPVHQLIWITRGQGRLLLEGQRRGIGAHNALFIPARTLFALDLGRQSIGHVIMIPEGTPLRLPKIPRHLRIRDVAAQSELTQLTEATLREDQGTRPLRSDALDAHGALMSVWLRRQIMQDEHVPDKANAAARLSKRYCDLLPQRYRSGDRVAAYADTLGVTATHLTRAVKAATGKTAADLLTERVLHEARRLLQETTEPAQNIARHLGFRSPAYFTRFIGQHTGASPSQQRGGT